MNCEDFCLAANPTEIFFKGQNLYTRCHSVEILLNRIVPKCGTLAQVQVLREEFRGQQPQLAHLEEVGAAALQRLEPHSADANKLREKVSDLQDRWNDLLNK